MAREALGDYLTAVGAQIRWQRARAPLLRELSDHITDQAADYRADGLEEAHALDRAVAPGTVVAEGVFPGEHTVNSLTHARLSDLGEATTLNDNTVRVCPAP